MSTQRIVQLLVAFASLTVISLVSERSNVLAAIVAVMPINITVALWFIFTGSGGDTAVAADFARLASFGLIPVMLFTVTCWVCFRRGWSLKAVLVTGYAIWFTATVCYRAIDQWVSRR
jgi:hypothetical protein